MVMISFDSSLATVKYIGCLWEALNLSCLSSWIFNQVPSVFEMYFSSFQLKNETQKNRTMFVTPEMSFEKKGKNHKLEFQRMDMCAHKHADCTCRMRTLDYMSMLCLPWHPSTVKISTTTGRNTAAILLVFKNHLSYHTKNVSDIRLQLEEMRLQQKWSFKITFTNSNFALCLHSCIVQQASSTAQATLTAWWMSGKTSCIIVSTEELQTH